MNNDPFSLAHQQDEHTTSPDAPLASAESQEFEQDLQQVSRELIAARNRVWHRLQQRLHTFENTPPNIIPLFPEESQTGKDTSMSDQGQPFSEPVRPPSRSKRWNTIFALVAAVVLLLVGVGSFLWFQNLTPQTSTTASGWMACDIPSLNLDGTVGPTVTVRFPAITCAAGAPQEVKQASHFCRVAPTANTQTADVVIVGLNFPCNQAQTLHCTSATGPDTVTIDGKSYALQATPCQAVSTPMATPSPYPGTPIICISASPSVVASPPVGTPTPSASPSAVTSPPAGIPFPGMTCTVVTPVNYPSPVSSPSATK